MYMRIGVSMKKAIQIDAKDNVATVTTGVERGEPVQIISESGSVISEVQASSRIPSFHKLAIAEIPKGIRILKYGETIGISTSQIQVGDWVHIHNVESAAVPTSAFRREEA